MEKESIIRWETAIKMLEAQIERLEEDVRRGHESEAAIPAIKRLLEKTKSNFEKGLLG